MSLAGSRFSSQSGGGKDDERRGRANNLSSRRRLRPRDDTSAQNGGSTCFLSPRNDDALRLRGGCSAVNICIPQIPEPLLHICSDRSVL